MTKRFKPGNRTAQQFMDYDYTQKLSPSEREWLARFNSEYYGHNFSTEPVHTDPTEARKEAIAREHAQRRDVWNNTYIEHLETFPNAITMDVSTEDLDYEEIYKRYGYKPALERITTDVLEDMRNPHLDQGNVLQNYYHKRERLRRIHEADRRNNGIKKEDSDAE